MKTQFNRRGALARMGAILAGVLALPVARTAKAAVQNFFTSSGAPKGYDPTAHKWLICLDATKCIGCGLCAEACKKENDVPQGPYYRTWVERYVITKPKPGSAETRGETLVDSPDGGMHGFPECPVAEDQIEQSFFVPKLCNLCENPPCVQVCPVGATFQAPDGAVLIDTNYCIGCAFCVQACPYGCPVFKSGHQHGREMHAVLSSHYPRLETGVCGNLSGGGAHFRRLEESPAGRSAPEIL